jgi:hypothetical protein
MSKSNSIGGFVPAAPLSTPNAPEPTTSPARGPSANPGTESAPVASRSSSLTTGSTLRASLPPMGQMQATSFARAQQNLTQLPPREMALVLLGLLGAASLGIVGTAPTKDGVSVGALAGNLHDLSKTQDALGK